jgi:hypothetical protein
MKTSELVLFGILVINSGCWQIIPKRKYNKRNALSPKT